MTCEVAYCIPVLLTYRLKAPRNFKVMAKLLLRIIFTNDIIGSS